MRHWNHRVLRTVVHGEVGYGIHEVYYNEAGIPWTWTADPVDPFGETVYELRRNIYHMLASIEKPVLEIAPDDPDTLREVCE